MAYATENPDGSTRSRVVRRVTTLFQATLAAAIVLALILIGIPNESFLAVSNYLQVVVAIAGSIVFFFCRSQCRKSRALLLAAAGFGLWGISNIGWYATVYLGMRALVFPSVIDIGMIAAFVILALAIRDGFPRSVDVSPYITPVLVAAAIVAGAAIMGAAGAGLSTLFALFYFAACGFLLATTYEYSGDRNPALLAGSFLLALAFVIYPLREMFFVQSVMLSAVGTFVSAGFSLIAIGWFAGPGATQQPADL